jgi:hypothetical protein
MEFDIGDGVFLSPVERGRGGLRSKPEWGSTTLTRFFALFQFDVNVKKI